MKLLVFSDSHCETEHMLHAVRRERPDVILHLGDHAADADALAEEFPFLPLYRVRGNCDFFDSSAQEQLLLQFGGVKIFAVHGHRYGVKSELLRLQYAAQEKEADVALFGHTHMPYCNARGGLQLLNPGACGGYAPSYGAIEIQNGSADCRVQEVYGEVIT